MKGLTTFMNFVYENYVPIIALFAIMLGVVLRVRNFFRQDTEAQKEQLRGSIDSILSYAKAMVNDLVADAEIKYGSGTGSIKKSYVYKELFKLIPFLGNYIEDGDITTTILGSLIDDAVDTLNSEAKYNENVGAIFNHDNNSTEELVEE